MTATGPAEVIAFPAKPKPSSVRKRRLTCAFASGRRSRTLTSSASRQDGRRGSSSIRRFDPILSSSGSPTPSAVSSS